MSSARLAVTVGDPAGIGPEVCEKALPVFLAERPSAQVVLLGPDNVVTALRARLDPSLMNRITLETGPSFSGPLGQSSRDGGAAALWALHRAIALARAQTIEAIVTAPVAKDALALAGESARGHTEILARELGNGPVAMAFFSPRLRVALVTVHVPLHEVPALLTSRRVVDVSALLASALQNQLSISEPRLGLCGLNPHAGEQGLLGHEEHEVLLPAAQMARAEGIRLSDPIAADTIFVRALSGEFDGVVALYHDQGLIPVKLTGFGEAVNVTLGLTTVRTSPDHGTAYDIVGQNKARADGMLSALRLAWRLVQARTPAAAL